MKETIEKFLLPYYLPCKSIDPFGREYEATPHFMEGTIKKNDLMASELIMPNGTKLRIKTLSPMGNTKTYQVIYQIIK